MEVQITESDLIEVLIEYYNSHSTECSPLQYLKRFYGRNFKFKSLGLGTYGQWMNANGHHFKSEKLACDFLEDVDVHSITEEQLLETVKVYFLKSEMFYHRRHVLDHIRSIYGNVNFSSYGFGTFKDFIKKHGLDMGIARKEDFKSKKDWSSWNGRVLKSNI